MEALSQSRSGSRSRRNSRPSTPTHFSLAPLTPRFPLSDYDPLFSADAPDGAEPEDYISGGARHSPNTHLKHSRNHPSLNLSVSTSYLASTSVPTTPKILSRNASRTRLNALGSTGYNYNPRMTKSKSSAFLRQSDPRSSPSSTHISRPKSNLNLAKHKRQDSEWLMRAGLALTTETREAKGQSWLAQRDSSTSLVSQSDEEEDMAIGGGRGRGARITAKSASNSPVLSRRGSRTRGGARGRDLYLTPVPSYTGALRKSDSPVAGMTPNFLDPEPDSAIPDEYDPDDLDHALGAVDEDADEEEEEDQEEIDEVEREMQRLTRERGFGLGGLVDRVMGWTLFENNEDDPSTATVQAHNLSKTRSERESTDIPGAEAKDVTGARNGDVDGDWRDEKEDVLREAGRPRQGEEGEVRWEDDAAWLIRVAGKIIL